jgi:hypothetical protein
MVRCFAEQSLEPGDVALKQSGTPSWFEGRHAARLTMRVTGALIFFDRAEMRGAVECTPRYPQ